MQQGLLGSGCGYVCVYVRSLSRTHTHTLSRSLSLSLSLSLARALSLTPVESQGTGDSSRAVEQLQILDRVRVFPDACVERDCNTRLDAEQLLCARRADAGQHLIRGLSPPHTRVHSKSLNYPCGHESPVMLGDFRKASAGRACALGVANAEEIAIDDVDSGDLQREENAALSVPAPAGAPAVRLNPDEIDIDSGDTSDGEDRPQRGEQGARGGGECGGGGSGESGGEGQRAPPMQGTEKDTEDDGLFADSGVNHVVSVCVSLRASVCLCALSSASACALVFGLVCLLG